MSLFNLACFYAYFHAHFTLILQHYGFTIVAAAWKVLYAFISTT